MKKNDSLLAKAIADANELKKVSIENAKAILNEQFDEKLKTMFDEKLSEEADESEEESEEDLDEKKKPEADETEAGEGEEKQEEDDVDETIDIDAILAEMGDTDKSEEDLDEKKKPEADETEESEESEEDLDEEIDINQLLSEFSSEDLDEKKKSPVEDEETEDEDLDEEDAAKDPNKVAKSALDKLIASLKIPASKVKKLYTEVLPQLAKAIIDNSDSAKTGLPMGESENVSELLETLNSVNTLNAKLMYFTKLVNEVDLSKAEKAKVLSVFDKTSSKKEAELVYSTLKEAYTAKKVKDTKKLVKESLGASAGKITGTGKKDQIVENSEFTRMQQLAGLLNG